MKKRITEKTAPNAKNVMQHPTRGKNAGAQSNGQFERDQKHGRGNFSRAGDAPRMVK